MPARFDHRHVVVAALLEEQRAVGVAHRAAEAADGEDGQAGLSSQISGTGRVTARGRRCAAATKSLPLRSITLR